MTLCEEYKIGGSPLPAPDAGVELSRTDVDASDAGRDESGVMHRIRVRSRVRSWTFHYSVLDGETYAYLQSLLEAPAEFLFTFPGPDGTAQTCQAYCAADSFSAWNLSRGLWRNGKFTVIEC